MRSQLRVVKLACKHGRIAIRKHSNRCLPMCRGERELFQMVDVPSGFQQSIYDDRQTAKGETSILQA